MAVRLVYLGTAKGVNTIIVPVPHRVARFGMAPRPRYWLKAGSRRYRASAARRHWARQPLQSRR